MEREMNVLVAYMHIWGTNLDFLGEANVLRHDSLLHLHCFLLSGNRPDKCRAFWVSRVANHQALSGKFPESRSGQVKVTKEIARS